MEGDLVVVRESRRLKHKLAFLWRGPRRVVSSVSPNVFVIEDLVSGKRKEIPARRMQFYKSTLAGRELSREEMSLVEHVEAHYEQVKQFHAIRKDGDTFYLHDEWRGLSDAIYGEIRGNRGNKGEIRGNKGMCITRKGVWWLSARETLRVGGLRLVVLL